MVCTGVTRNVEASTDGDTRTTHASHTLLVYTHTKRMRKVYVLYTGQVSRVKSNYNNYTQFFVVTVAVIFLLCDSSISCSLLALIPWPSLSGSQHVSL